MLTATQGDLDAVWDVPNTIGYVLAREGIRLNHVRGPHHGLVGAIPTST